jgi:hypothetical protein
MAFNNEKIMNILIDHIDQLDEKCVGYKDEMNKLVKHLIRLETEHSVTKTNVAQQIEDYIIKLGRFLNEKQVVSENREQ